MRLMVHARLAILACVCLGIVQAQDDAPKLRLDGNAVPERYRLQLQLDPARDDFSGSEEIDVAVSRPTRTIWLHAHGLTIQDATVDAGGKKLPARARSSGDFLGIDTDAPVGGRATLHLTFSGNVERRDPIGIFLRTENKDRFLYTQFEAISARRAFPCFDEPSYKTPWDLTLTAPESQAVFANTPAVTTSKLADGRKAVHFAETKPLPSYLVAFAVGPFETVDLGTAGQNRTPLRIIVPRGRQDRVAFAKEIIPKTLVALEGYFNIPYPYPTLDQIEIAFAAPFAMENAGLITYGAGLLTAPPRGMSVHQQRETANVIAHEMAHQWFGDYVTTAWWNDIWLNEAFATWCAAKIVDQLRPEWHAMVGQQAETRFAMYRDALASARRIRQPIEVTADIEQAFDAITYEKGAAVIRMFENYLGPDVFRAGVRKYIDTHANRTATAPDFLSAVSSAAGQDVASPFSTFLDRVGVPLLTVSLECADGLTPRLSVAQQRLVPAGSQMNPDMVWQLPVCVHYGASASSGRKCHVVTKEHDNFELKGAQSCPAWLMADENAAGYYAVRYSPELYRKLAAAPAGSLPLIERASLLDNEWVLLKSGRTQATEALSLARMFSTGPERELITRAADIVTTVEDAVPTELRPRYAHFIRETFGPLAHKIGWRPGANESDDTRMLRSRILPLVAVAGKDTGLQKDAVSLAREWLKGNLKYDQGTVGAILTAAAATNDPSLFEELTKAADTLKEHSERRLAADALGDFTDPALAERALKWLLEGDHAQLAHGLAFRMMENPETRLVPWHFLEANYERLKAAIPAFMVTQPGVQLIDWGSSLCSTAAGKAEAQRFFQPKFDDSPEARRPLAQLYETLDLCAARNAALVPSLSEFLRQY